MKFSNCPLTGMLPNILLEWWIYVRWEKSKHSLHLSVSIHLTLHQLYFPLYKCHQPTTLSLLPVPLHPSRKRKRGYNQAQILAEEIGKILEIPVDSKSLIRTRKTSPQKKLGHQERKKNLCLIISSFSLSWRMQRYRHNNIRPPSFYFFLEFFYKFLTI